MNNELRLQLDKVKELIKIRNKNNIVTQDTILEGVFFNNIVEEFK